MIKLIVVVGSQNDAKVKSASMALARIFPSHDIEVKSVSVESGVSVQPMSDEECIKGIKISLIFT